MNAPDVTPVAAPLVTAGLHDCAAGTVAGVTDPDAGTPAQQTNSDPVNERDQRFMRLALAAAERARAAGEVPVGAVLVRGDEVIETGFNQPIGAHDPSAHAEMAAQRAAAKAVGN